MTKTCQRCKQLKPIKDFGCNKSKPDGHNGYCRSCNKQYRQRYRIYYRERYKNREDIRTKAKEYNRERRQKIPRITQNEKMQQWRRAHPDETNKISLKSYYKHHKKRILQKRKHYLENRQQCLQRQSAYQKQKKKTDIIYRLKCNLRTRLLVALKRNYKSGSAVRDLGCSIEELKIYLESKFQEGMSWENYGLKGWHIDHIIPLDNFNLIKREEFLKACYYTNLQPMWWKENMVKGSKMIF